jgi:hypothetical protein
MKEFIVGLVTMIMGVTVFTVVSILGLIYGLGYSTYMSIIYKDIKYFFKYWWKMIDGLFSSIGHIMYEIAIGFDFKANVLGGELMEDFVSHKSVSHFGEKQTTISASIGELELKSQENELYKSKKGRVLSEILNIVFNQKQHCIDSWKFKLAKEKILSEHFEKRKDKK